MSAGEALYAGQCASDATQTELVAWIRKVAEGCGIIQYDQVVEGRIAVEHVQIVEGRLITQEVVVGRIGLFGIEFSLRENISPESNKKVSFVFMRTDQSAFNGQLCRVFDPATSRSHFECYVGRVFPPDLEGAWRLVRCYVHTRYFFEEWIAKLLAGVKHFFIPSLWYHNWMDYGEDASFDGELGGYVKTAAYLDSLADAFGQEQAKERYAHELASELRSIQRELDEPEKRRK